MSISFATDSQIAEWNELVNANPGGGAILQGYEFIMQKANSGWKPRFIMIGTRAVAALEKSIPLMGRVWYIPKGPATDSVSDLSSLLDELTPFARQHGVFSIKIEPELDHTTDMSALGCIKTRPIQYNFSTVLVDLSPSIDEILTALPQKGRHAIRRAERDGVIVKQVEPTAENCQTMYALFQETATDAGFAIRPTEYYQSFYHRYGENGGLFFAYVGETVVAGAFAMVQGGKSVYKDGASVREKVTYGASHLLQWEVIKWAKSLGSLEHDLAGVPPIADIKDPNHPFYGLGRFKTSFNKTVTQYVGAYDVPARPLRAKLWHAYIEKIVRRLYFRRHHESFY